MLQIQDSAASMLLGVAVSAGSITTFAVEEALAQLVVGRVSDLGGLAAGLSVGLMLYRKAQRWHYEDREYLARANRELREQAIEDHKTAAGLHETVQDLLAELERRDTNGS